MSSAMAPMATPSSTGTGTTSGSSTSTSSSLSVDKDMFLQLLVAQLKNQDPLSPTDSTQFVTQLAQYEQLEQSVNSGEDISAIRTDVDTLVASLSTSSTKGSESEG